MSPDDIPVSVTQLVYTDPHDATGRLSQNQLAIAFTHYWPEIQRCVREQIACEIETVALGRLDEPNVLDCKPSDQARYQEWRDAAQVARGEEVAW